MQPTAKLAANDLVGFSEALLSHSKDFWSSLLDSVSRHSASSVFLDAHGREATLAAANLLVSRLEDHRNHVFRLSHLEAVDQAPGFLAFEGLVDKLRNEPGWFRTQGLPSLPSIFEKLEHCSTFEEFDALMERHWEEFSPLSWGRNCIDLADRTAQQILENARDVQRLHLIFELPKLWDTHIFNVILILFRSIVRSESLNTPVLWFLSDRQDEESLKYTDLLHSLLRLESSRIQRHPVPSPNPYAIRMFVEGRASPLQRPKSEKLALDLILAATNAYEEQEADSHYFVPTIWRKACQAHVGNFFVQESEGEGQASDGKRPQPEKPDLALLFRACCFQDVQRSLGGGGDPRSDLTPLQTYLLALSLWYAPNRSFERWNNRFFKDSHWREFGQFVTVTLLRVCAFFREFQTITDVRREMMAEVPPRHALHMHMGLIDLLLARMLGDGEVTRELQKNLEELKSRVPAGRDASHPEVEELELILTTAKCVNLCFLNPERESPESVVERLKEAEANASRYKTVARAAPVLLPLYSHSLITVNNTLAENGLDIDPIEMLKTELETRYRIYPISEQCLHLGNLATELAENGLYSEACERIGESLAIAKYSGDETYRAYARHDYINTRYQGGLIPPDFHEWLDEAHAILEAANIPLEFWRTQALEVITGLYAGESRRQVHQRAQDLIDWTRQQSLDVPFELVQENPIDLIRELTSDDAGEIAVPAELGHCPEAIEIQVGRALQHKDADSANRLLMAALTSLQQKKPTRAATTINTLAGLASHEIIRDEVRRAVRQETLSRFVTLYFQGWRHFSERQALLASPCIQGVLRAGAAATLPDPDTIIRIASEGLSLISDPRDLRLSTAMILRFLTEATAVSIYTKRISSDELESDVVFSGTRILDASLREGGEPGPRASWSVVECEPEPQEVALSRGQKGSPTLVRSRVTASGSRWISNETSLTCQGSKVAILFRTAPIFCLLSFPNDANAKSAMDALADIGSLPLLLVAVRMSLDRIAERDRILTLEREADSIAERRSAMARELSELLGKEREKLYSDLLSTNRSLEKLSRRLEAALTITREMYVAGHRVQAILKAAGHILRSLAWKEPCYVEAWMHESFGKKTGRYAHCHIQGIEALTRLAEQNPGNAEKIRIEIVESAPKDFPPDTLRASALSGCSIDNGILSVPVSHKGYGLALLHIGGVDARFFTTDDEDFIDTLVHSLGIVLSNMEFLEAEKEALVELVNQAITYGPRLHKPILELGNVARTLELNQDFALHKAIQDALGRVSGVARDLTKMEFIASRIGRIGKQREEDPDSGVS